MLLGSVFSISSNRNLNGKLRCRVYGILLCLVILIEIEFLFGYPTLTLIVTKSMTQSKVIVVERKKKSYHEIF